MENKDNLGCLLKGHRVSDDRRIMGKDYAGTCDNCKTFLISTLGFEHRGVCNWEPYEQKSSLPDGRPYS